MKLSITSSDIELIETIYYQFYNKFLDTPKKEAALEIIVGNSIYTDPSWNKVQELYQTHNRIKIAYNLNDKKD